MLKQLNNYKKMETEKLTFDTQETPLHVYVGVIDTVCTGWDCWKVEIDNCWLNTD